MGILKTVLILPENLEIPPREAVCPPLLLEVPADNPSWTGGVGDLERQHYFAELLRLPEVLPVNSNFDEGIIETGTGYALPDSSDANLKADREIPWKQIKQGDLITKDLHQGWFGLSPEAFAEAALPWWFPENSRYSFYQGASLKIRKIAQTDPDTDAPESGHVRFWVTKGDGESAGAWAIDPYDQNTPAFTPIELVGKAYGPNAEVPPPAANVRYWVEGLTPGKCTLEFTCFRGPHSFSHTQTFLVATQKTKSEWQDEVHHQIRLQTSVASNGHLPLDFAQYDPAAGFFESKCERGLGESREKPSNQKQMG